MGGAGGQSDITELGLKSLSILCIRQNAFFDLLDCTWLHRPLLAKSAYYTTGVRALPDNMQVLKNISIVLDISRFEVSVDILSP